MQNCLGTNKEHVHTLKSRRHNDLQIHFIYLLHHLRYLSIILNAVQKLQSTKLGGTGNTNHAAAVQSAQLQHRHHLQHNSDARHL